ncbi:PQQ-like beta-propeller repeat protein [Stieleria sp. TO1_6]|uniref:PQQ-binding-like beta-propeller repeat protein n=1 Tax=Stieleria tagensis TaxID=2956795 RepID=UPI00209AC82A|nr:PQQ-binding-like beta-propeller repeat protein [Stieleria tagensis]MCO8122860.1 PQQ-like beta-propeller repeat protein [Stieleria tagensis]
MQLGHPLYSLLKTALLSAASLALVTTAAADDSWPTFRGTQRSGISSDTGLLQDWPDEGPELIWTAEGAGRGYASLAIADGKIYTLGDGLSTASDKDEYLVCFDQETGNQLWTAKTGEPWTSGKPTWQSSRSTPTVDGDRVYVLTAQGQLICFTTDGSEVWRKHLKEDLGGEKADSWGYSESVLIDGDRLICTPGGPQNTMVALDKMTGETVWTTARDEDRGAGHASVVISQVGDQKVYVQTTGSGAMGVRASDGKLLWTYDIKKTTSVIPTSIVKDDLVFFVAGYGTGGTLIRQVPDGQGNVTAEEIYPTNPKLGNKHGGVILVGDYLYGDSEDSGIPYCAELMTGDVQWKSRGAGKKSASMTAADGKLYIRFSDGTMALAKASPDEYEELASFKIPGSGDRPSWSHPVILDGKLYLREGDQVLCYQLRS